MENSQHHWNNVWVRLAVNREGALIWRCFIDPEIQSISVERAEVTGVSTVKNLRTAHVPDRTQKDKARELIAWLWYYGEDVLIRDNVLHIRLGNPLHEPSF